MRFTKGNVAWNKGIPCSNEKKKKISQTLKGHIPWNKGKTDVYSEETKEAMSKTTFKEGHIPWNKGKVGIISGDKNPFYGKKHTEETKKKMSESHKDCIPWNKGKVNVFSKETRLKMSQNRVGKQKGENNPAWKGGVTPLNNLIRKTKEYKEWAISVYKKYKYICQCCGIKCKAKNIIAHHIKSFTYFPKLRFDINNGVTLCRSCHIKYHKE